MNGSSAWTLGWRTLWRDLRAGELRLLIVAVMLAVAALSSVGFFADRLQAGLQRDARQLLGGDVVIANSEYTADLIRRQHPFASGRIPPKAEAGLAAFLEHAPEGAGPAAVRIAAARSGNPPKEISRNGRILAKALHIACPFWLGGA